MAKQAAKKKYTVRIDCRSDETGKEFKAGDVITDADFPAKVIKNWLEIGVLEVEDGAG